jgi:hypothetical protein
MRCHCDALFALIRIFGRPAVPNEATDVGKTGSRGSSLCAIGLTAGVRYPVGADISLFAIMSRPALGPTQSLTQRMPGVLYLGAQWPVHDADHLVSKLRMRWAIPPRHQNTSMMWYLLKHGDFIFYFYFGTTNGMPGNKWYCRPTILVFGPQWTNLAHYKLGHDFGRLYSCSSYDERAIICMTCIREVYGSNLETICYPDWDFRGHFHSFYAKKHITHLKQATTICFHFHHEPNTVSMISLRIRRSWRRFIIPLTIPWNVSLVLHSSLQDTTSDWTIYMIICTSLIPSRWMLECLEIGHDRLHLNPYVFIIIMQSYFNIIIINFIWLVYLIIIRSRNIIGK